MKYFEIKSQFKTTDLLFEYFQFNTIDIEKKNFKLPIDRIEVTTNIIETRTQHSFILYRRGFYFN